MCRQLTCESWSDTAEAVLGMSTVPQVCGQLQVTMLGSPVGSACWNRMLLLLVSN